MIRSYHFKAKTKQIKSTSPSATPSNYPLLPLPPQSGVRAILQIGNLSLVLLLYHPPVNINSFHAQIFAGCSSHPIQALSLSRTFFCLSLAAGLRQVDEADFSSKVTAFPSNVVCTAKHDTFTAASTACTASKRV
jgi:hypothetical protein